MIVVALIVYSEGKDFTIGKLANLGDFFGGILNPIFAFLAFLALLVTIILQATELKATRKEIRKSSKTQKKQSKSLKLQNKAIKLQIFENTFFNLNDMYLKTKANVSFYVQGRNEIKYGTTAISELLNVYRKQYFCIFSAFSLKYRDNISTYFKIIFQILEYIDENKLDNANQYVKILTTQFSNEELEFIFYYCIHNGTEVAKFKLLLEKYRFFEYMICNEDIDKLISEYKITVFGNNMTLREKHKDYSKS